MAPTPTKDRLLDASGELFRRQGYTGTGVKQILTEASAPFGSLYHHFPGGKEEMAEEVLAHLDRKLTTAIYEPIKSTKTPQKKLTMLLDGIDAFYESGKRACLLERLVASVDRTRFRRPLRNAFAAWIDAVESICIEAGLPKSVARARAEDLVVRIDGALIVAAGTDDYSVFARTIKDLRHAVLAPVR